MRLPRLINACSAACDGLAFLLRNLWCCRRIPEFAPTRHAQLSVEPLQVSDLAAVFALYALLNDGKPPGTAQRMVMRLLGGRLCLTAWDARGRLAGILMFYFNARDRREGSVHEAYIGVAEWARGKGLSAYMRGQALQHFAAAGVARSSSRISSSNQRSLRTNLKLGYVPIETYYDMNRNEERHYLVCELARFRRPSDQTNMRMHP